MVKQLCQVRQTAQGFEFSLSVIPLDHKPLSLKIRGEYGSLLHRTLERDWHLIIDAAEQVETGKLDVNDFLDPILNLVVDKSQDTRDAKGDAQSTDADHRQMLETDVQKAMLHGLVQESDDDGLTLTAKGNLYVESLIGLNSLNVETEDTEILN